MFNSYYLTHKGLLDYQILFPSKYLVAHKADYYACLGGVSQRGDWASWLRAVEATATHTHCKINNLAAAKDAVLPAVAADTRLERPDQLVRLLFTQPFTTVKHLTSAKLYVENTARKDLNQLTDLGVLDKRTIAGHHHYLNLELHRILGK